MKRIILLVILSIILSCTIRHYNLDEARYIKGVVYKIDGEKYRAVYVCVDSTQSIKICNYTGDKNINDSISIAYTVTKYQNDFLCEDK